MFQVEHFEASTTQNWLVKQFMFFQFEDSFLTEKFVPRPDISLIFHFKNIPLIINDREICLEPFFCTPILSKSIFLTCHEAMDTFVVICNPTVLSHIFNLNLTPPFPHNIKLPHHIFYPLWHDLSKLKTPEERIYVFGKFVDLFQKTHYVPDVIDILYDKITKRGVTTLIKDIVPDCPACQRTLERNFIRRTGVSPKTLMRIMRIDYLWAKIKDEKAIDYQDLIFNGNYFDQAHFIKDFKSIIGETPTYFFNRNLTVPKMLSGRAEGEV